jgi:hypothetical protein
VLVSEPVHGILPCGTPSSAQVHEVPSLDQFAVNEVEVVPFPGLMDAEQVGAPAPSTNTLLDVHVLLPAGPVAVSVTE